MTMARRRDRPGRRRRPTPATDAPAGRASTAADAGPASSGRSSTGCPGPAIAFQRIGFGIVGSVVAGVASALLGIGGGLVKVPVMHVVMGVPLRVATATSNLMMGITASAGAMIYLLRGGIDPYVAGADGDRRLHRREHRLADRASDRPPDPPRAVRRRSSSTLRGRCCSERSRDRLDPPIAASAAARRAEGRPRATIARLLTSARTPRSALLAVGVGADGRRRDRTARRRSRRSTSTAVADDLAASGRPASSGWA